MNYLSDLARVVWPGSGSSRGMFSGPSVVDQMTANDQAIAELEQMGYGKFSPEVVDVKMQNPMIYAMGTGPIQSVSRRGLFDIFRSQKPPAIIKPTPPPTLDLSPTGTVFDPVPTTPPTSNLPAVVDPEMFRAAQTGSGRAIEALSRQLGSDPRDQQALAEILKRAEGFINPELNRRQLLQSLAGAVARKVVGVSPLDVLKESVTPPKVVVDPVQIAAEAVEKWLPQEMEKFWKVDKYWREDAESPVPEINSFVERLMSIDDEVGVVSAGVDLMQDISKFTGIPLEILKAGGADKIVRRLVRQFFKLHEGGDMFEMVMGLDEDPFELNPNWRDSDSPNVINLPGINTQLEERLIKALDPRFADMQIDFLEGEADLLR